VLIVDDSAFARKVLRECLSGRAEVVGFARDGLEALEKIVELEPDIVTLDLMMPNLDGLGVLRELRSVGARARAILVSSSDRDSELVVEALRLGAVDIVKKPTSLATDVLYEMAGELVDKVLAAAPSEPKPFVVVARPARPRSDAREIELVVIGTSTGGPNALSRVLSRLPPDFPAPIAVALHIPAEYTFALARRLDEDCALAVVEAGEETELLPGRVVLAKGGMHLNIARGHRALVARTSLHPRDADYFPSVDILFETAAAAAGERTLGVVLTGMGCDGARGARALVRAGASIVTEAAETCIVYGMPRSVEEAGLAAAVVPLDDVADELVRRVGHRAVALC
jgi:two-component system chemotaxis response regulator CheB